MTYYLGLDPEGDFANKTRVADTAAEIVEGLRTFLAPGSIQLTEMIKRAASYDRSLTNVEVVLATQMALAIYQVDLINRLAEMYVDEEDEE
ncbi:hypothetical protein MRS76_24385 [Rhizobiaceae bacterium n13]|uniref:hypothetical protein n=1 Tax=Ferirhizobium litorale TaxID=2927786 RepID=UPI0024B31102|nr:hypothetical protein [Fererhizobium litorale]MDI7865059.1 hypothetical protein [Fererhizobium litorale]